MAQVPSVSSDSTSGTQTVGPPLVYSVIAPPMQAATVPDAIDGLIATHSRNLGGDVSARLIAASMRQTSNQLDSAYETIATQASDLKVANSVITDLKVENASLTTKLNEVIGSNRLRQITTFVGTALLGMAVDLYKNGLIPSSLLLGLLGLGLLVFTSIPSRRGNK